MPNDESTPLDPIDRRIAGVLANHGRMSVADVAQAVSLSRSATSERIRRLERDGWILGYEARLAPELSGRTLEVIIDATARTDANRTALEAWLAQQPAVFEALHLTGSHDYLIRARCRDTAELDNLVDAMKTNAQIAATQTRLVLRRVPTEPDLFGV